MVVSPAFLAKPVEDIHTPKRLSFYFPKYKLGASTAPTPNPPDQTRGRLVSLNHTDEGTLAECQN